jgi:hypothetical protein
MQTRNSHLKGGNKVYNYDDPKYQHPCFKPEMVAGTMLYPNIYYKLQPHIMMACDEMDMYGITMPSKKMIMCMCSRICDNVCKMYPEMVKYDMEYSAGEMSDPDPEPGFDEFGHRMRRGPFRDFLAFLLLSEFFRRRRRY